MCLKNLMAPGPSGIFEGLPFAFRIEQVRTDEIPRGRHQPPSPGPWVPISFGLVSLTPQEARVHVLTWSFYIFPGTCGALLPLAYLARS